MSDKILRTRWAVEPAIAILFLSYWVFSESGRGLVELVGIIVVSAAIGISRAFPTGSLVLAAALLSLQGANLLVSFSATSWPVYLGFGIAAGLICTWARRPTIVIAVVASVLLSVAVVAVLLLDSVDGGWLTWTGQRVRGEGIWGWDNRHALVNAAALLGAGALVWIALCCWIGCLVRRQFATWTQLGERLDASEVEIALAELRERIAQEMHDSLAHSLAVIAAQADGARYASGEIPKEVEHSLVAIGEQARAALADVGALIDGMLDGAAPTQPSLDELDDLMRTVRSVGLEVTLTEAGERVALTPAKEAAIVRILQEGLTNALRHRGRGSTARIILDWRGPGLSIQLVSSGDGEVVEIGTTGGRGLVGLQQRARFVGGWLSAGVDDAGDHRLTAFVPFARGELAVPA